MVGIGSGINSQTLHEIAGQKGNVLAVESFDELAKELGEIKDKVCGRLIYLMHDDVTRTKGSMGVVVTLKSKMASRIASSGTVVGEIVKK